MKNRAELFVQNLDAAIADHVAQGFRLDMTMPADQPRFAVVSRHGEQVRLVATNHAPPAASRSAEAFLITRASDQTWVTGRAGMEYRDLMPDRLGGRFIASHIRIPKGGPVDDYVHHHAIRFQMIYCRRGWVRVVYEDQGPPFLMHEGDCVLQPPAIRHRVLESSPGLEVIEIASPAEHETWRDHDLELPTPKLDPQRKFGGQRFVRHIAAGAGWHDNIRDLGIAAATDGFAGARVLRLLPENTPAPRVHDRELLFFSMLKGHARLRGRALGTHTLEVDDACVVPSGADYALEAAEICELLEVTLPAR